MVSGRAVDPEDARQLMVRNGYLPTTVFQKATAPWPCICDRCKGLRGEQWSDSYTETVLLEDPARGRPWSLLTPVALWTDVAMLTERLGFDLDEQRATDRT